MTAAAPRRLALVLAYEGTAFQGWQSQAGRGGRTVQETLEDAIARLTGESAVVEGCGRTDAGAHALGFVAHADLACVPTRPRRRLNGVLPKDVRVLGAALVTPSFHARKSAKGKRYAYRFWVGHAACPLRRHVTHHVGRLDLAAMRVAAGAFVGERDFRSLQAAGSSVATSVRRITRCELTGEPPDVRLVVEGSGFLRHMVRAIAGSLLVVGRGRPPSWIEEMLERRSRDAAGANVPAKGLVLEAVSYDEPHAGLLLRAQGDEDPAESEDAR